MHIQKLIIHNFRSFLHEEIDIERYAVLVGENNAGKSNIFRAIRVFYEDIKYDSKSDFPKLTTIEDEESRIEIHYQTTDEEQESLKDEYKSSDNILKIRKYLKGDKAKNAQSNLYAYEGGILSENLFYGAKNIASAKLGQLLFIPELSKVDDNLKTSGPSPLREMINFVMKKVIKGSTAFGEMEKFFEEFNDNFKGEESADGFSISSVQNDINKEIGAWGVEFGLNINKINADDIVKNLISHSIKDLNLTKGNNYVSIDSFGQGLQRNLIYSLIKLSTKYKDKIIKSSKDFNPDFTLILFEEPELFLHPSQQSKLNIELKKLSKEESQQIFITTHCPLFISKNIDDITSIIRIGKTTGISQKYQLTTAALKDLFNENNSFFKFFSDKLTDTITGENIKTEIRSKKLGSENPDDLLLNLDREQLKYLLRMDSERTSVFFAKKVIICEGPTEKIFLDYLLNTEREDLKDEHIYILDAGGKFSLHRFMNLLGELGIIHSIIMDKDNSQCHDLINEFIDSKKNHYTKKIYKFETDIEGFLGIDKPQRNDQKPANVLSKYIKGEINENKITELKDLVVSII